MLLILIYTVCKCNTDFSDVIKLRADPLETGHLVYSVSQRILAHTSKYNSLSIYWILNLWPNEMKKKKQFLVKKKSSMFKEIYVVLCWHPIQKQIFIHTFRLYCKNQCSNERHHRTHVKDAAVGGHSALEDKESRANHLLQTSQPLTLWGSSPATVLLKKQKWIPLY